MWYFVYGTLLQGMSNRHLIEAEILRGYPALITGTLYHLPCGYPMLIEKDGGTTRGEVLQFTKTSPVTAVLDRLEDFIAPGHPDNLYERVEREVVVPELDQKIRARVYVCPAHREKYIRKIGIPVPGGDWRKFVVD